MTECSVLLLSDVVIVESSKVDGIPERKKFGRMKLLQFSENHRPAYWGTWNKKTTVIHPRDPWAQDRVSMQAEVPVVWTHLYFCVSFSLCLYTGLFNSLSIFFLLCPFLPTLRGGNDALHVCFLRSFWITRWTVMMSGKRRSQESLSLTVKG